MNSHFTIGLRLNPFNARSFSEIRRFIVIGAVIANIIVGVSCIPPQKESIPYQYGLNLLVAPDPLGDPVNAPTSDPNRSKIRLPRRTQLLDRSKAHLGTMIGSSPHKALHAWHALLCNQPLCPSNWLLALVAESHPTTIPQAGDLIVYRLPEAVGSYLLAVVETVRWPNLTFIYPSGKWVRRGYLDINRPHLRRENRSSRIVNSYIRLKQPDDPPETRYLAGELLVGFIRLEP